MGSIRDWSDDAKLVAVIGAVIVAVVFLVAGCAIGRATADSSRHILKCHECGKRCDCHNCRKGIVCPICKKEVEL